MESTQNLKRRMRSVENIGTITKAMELVAATKMRRAQELALSSRPYAYTALEILGIIANLKDLPSRTSSDEVRLGGPMPDLLRERAPEEKTGRTAFVVVTSDKGLAGSFNSAVIRKFENYVRANGIDLHARAGPGTVAGPAGKGDPKYSFIAVGQKAKSYLERRGLAVSRSFVRVGDFTRMEEVDPISEFLIAGYLERNFDDAISFSMNFVTALRQEVLVREILPISFEKIKESIELLTPQAGRYSQYLDAESFAENKNAEYVIEPTPREVLASLSRELLKIRIYHMILEANASEHSARRVAMKNASDNAAELSENLNIDYNKSRQAAITNQIIEVTSGAQALT